MERTSNYIIVSLGERTSNDVSVLRGTPLKLYQSVLNGRISTYAMVLNIVVYRLHAQNAIRGTWFVVFNTNIITDKPIGLSCELCNSCITISKGLSGKFVQKTLFKKGLKDQTLNKPRFAFPMAVLRPCTTTTSSGPETVALAPQWLIFTFLFQPSGV